MANVLMNKVMKPEQVSYLEEKYELKIYTIENDEIPGDEILQGIEIFVGWRPEKLIEAMPNIKWVHLYSAGVDRYIENFRKMSSPPRLTNNRGTYAVPLSEHSLALLLAVIRKINIYVKNQIERKWHYERRVREIYGSTVGIVGFGDVGRYSARMMKGLGASVLAHRLHKSEKPEYVDRMYYGNEGLDEMLSQCDYIFMSLPGTEDTRYLFDRERMLRMKEGAVIVNVGRGYVVDCDALSELIESGRLGGAGLDVTDPEPLPEGHKLWGLDRVVITPHMAGSSPNAGVRSVKVFEENLTSYLAGERMPNEIDIVKGY